MAIQQTIKNVVLAKSGAAPATTDVISISAPVLVSPTVKVGDYDDIGSGFMGNKKSYVDPNFVTCDLDIKVLARCASTPGIAPKIGNLLKIAGLTETITANTQVEYKNGNNAGVGSGQLSVYSDGYKYAITGAGADFKLEAKIGQPMEYQFKLKGFTTPAATAEANPTVALDSAVMPLVTKISVLTVGGTTINADSFTLDCGNKIEEEYDIGLSYYYLNRFEPTFKVDAVKTIGTDEQTWTDYAAATPKVILVQLGTAGNMIEINIPRAVLSALDQKDDKGKVKLGRTFGCEAVAGNDNFSIVYK